VLAAILLAAPLVAFVPMASLAGLLLLVAWNMSEVRHFVNILRIAPKSDVFVLLSCYLLTVVFDMVIAVSFGVVMAALLFMRRTAELTQARMLEGARGESDYALEPGVAVYEIAGPLFFGAAQNAMGALGSVAADTRVVVLALGGVPSIDATGFVALESALSRLRTLKKWVVLTGPLPEPRVIFERANLPQHHEHVRFAETVEAELVGMRAPGDGLAPPRRPNLSPSSRPVASA